MKKNIKIIVLVYVGLACLTYVLTLRIERLEAQDDINIQNKRVALRVR